VLADYGPTLTMLWDVASHSVLGMSRSSAYEDLSQLDL